MDPLTALGVGANIMQVVNFGVELVRVTRNVIAGDRYDTYDIQKTHSDLKNLVDNLTNAENFSSDVDVEATEQPTQALKRLARDCQMEAEAMIPKIERFLVRLDDSAKISRKAALKVAALAIWNKSEIEAMAVRIDRYRSQLGLRMLDVMNARFIAQGTSIVEIFSLTQTVNSSVQAIAAMLKNSDGSVNTILGNQQPPQSNSLKDTLSVTYKEQGFSSTARDGNETYDHIAAMAAVPFSKVAQRIVESLWFSFISSRQEMVEDPFEKTLDWIAGDQSATSTEWHDFPEWLSSGQGCYWISGKAGSGKSTLMKYIAGHPVLAQCLRKWAGDDQLLKATFFFWRAGVDLLQRSQEGLIRAILLQILDRRRDLITVCFPTLCNKLASTDRSYEELKIGFDELKMAFSLLAKHDLPKTKVFLLIDGLDEYQGDHRNLVDLLSPIIKSPVMKVLVSSRPIPLLHQAFSKCPSLQIHNLTLNDIKHYAEASLCSDDTLATMERLEPGISCQIIDTIVSKASGVFLWVKIVVRDLLYGLAHHESLGTLLLNVDKLPRDLEQLYDHMFTSMDPSYRQEASHLLRLFKRSQEVQFVYPMTALQLVFTQMMKARDPEDIPWKSLSVDGEDAHCELIEGKLRSRCCGLLEIQKSYWGSQDRRRYVGFLHRTVMDYIEQDSIQAQISNWDSMSADIDKILFSSCVMEIRQYTERNKSSETSNTQPDRTLGMSQLTKRGPSTYTRILHAMALRPLSQSGSQDMYEAIIKELSQTFFDSPITEREEVNKCAMDQAIHPLLKTLGFTPDDRSQGFWMFAALHGVGFPSQSPSAIGFKNAQCKSLALLNSLMHLSHPLSGSISSRIVYGITELLSTGADPNEPCLFFDSIETANAPEQIKVAVRLAPKQEKSLIPWIFWLSCKQDSSPIISGDYLLYMRLLANMVDAGASLQGFSSPIDPGADERICKAINGCIEAMPSTSKEALDLRTHLQTKVRIAVARSSKDSGTMQKASKPWKLPLRFPRRKTNET